jgi:hypothetical protein
MLHATQTYEIAPSSDADKASRCRFFRSALNMLLTASPSFVRPSGGGKGGESDSCVAVMMGDGVSGAAGFHA